MRIKPVVFSCSLLLASWACADYAQLSRRLSGTTDFVAASGLVRQDEQASQDAEILRLLQGPHTKRQLDLLKEAVDLRAFAERGPAQVDAQAVAKAKAIKGSLLYRDPTERSQSNWLRDAADNFEKLIEDIPKARAPRGGPALPWIGVAMYVILGGLLIAFLAYAVSRIRLRRRLRRQTSALLEEDEPERTLDEWILMADDLEAQGRYREAVRCLYLACLLKFDEAGVARFERSQTNWEHLRRIESSSRPIESFDFREPTKAFDRIWYGFKLRGREDATLFRSWYLTLSSLLAKEAA